MPKIDELKDYYYHRPTNRLRSGWLDYVEIEEFNDVFIAKVRFPDAEVMASGITRQSAIDTLKISIIDYFTEPQH